MATEIKLKIIPRSSRNQMIQIGKNEYKVKLTAAPIDGKANKELIDLLSKTWKVPRSRLKITKGLKSRSKVVEVA